MSTAKLESPDRGGGGETPLGPLHSGFRQWAIERPDLLALTVGEASLTYGDLDQQARALAATLDAYSMADPPVTGVFAHRTESAYAGVLAALYRGHGYVPLRRDFPPARTVTMIERSECRSLIVDAESAVQLHDIIPALKLQMTFVIPDLEDVSELGHRWRDHRFLGARDVTAGTGYKPKDPPEDAIAYILFTSGSTGTPKGVGVTHGNVRHFIDAVVDRYDIRESDRLSQTFDMTFDVSVFDMFVAWQQGASVHCPTGNTLIKPGRFIRNKELTVWFSVPSTAIFMKQFGELKPGSFPSLRWSLFAGEALPIEVARAWAEAAPESVVENLYGPTEATIVCTIYRWGADDGPGEAEHGVVPIGWPVPGSTVLVVDDALEPVPDGEEGELLVAGPQVTPGYLDDAEKTNAAFVRPAGVDAIHYRTGDRVRRMPNGGPLRYLGRKDSQIKINGQRVELAEIEAAFRDATGLEAVVAMGWPPTPGGAGAVDVFVAGEVDSAAVRSALASRLPRYMVPRRIHQLDVIPLNDNGKYDRRALRTSLEEMS